MSDSRRSALPAPLVSVPETASSTLPAETDPVYQMVKRAEINAFEVEDASAQAVEITVLWNRAVLHVAHLRGATPFVLTARAPALASPTRRIVPGLAAGAVAMMTGAALTGGAAGALAVAGAIASAASLGAGVAAHQANERVRNDPSRFLVDASMLPGEGDVPVVVHDDGTARFVFPAGARGEVEIDGAKRSLTDLVAQGHARPSPVIPGGHEVALVPGGRYRVELGGVTVAARVVAPGRRVAGSLRRDPPLVAAGLGAAAVVAAMLGTMALAASDGGGMLSAEDHDQALADLRAFVRNQSEREVPPVPQEAARAAETGTAAAGAAGAMGSRASTEHNHRYELRRTDDHEHLARNPAPARDQLLDRGIFRALGPGAAIPQGGMLTNVFGEMTTSGPGERDANGAMTGDTVGESYGGGGLDSVGTGIGGGGDANGSIGTGRMGTMGHGNCLPGQDCGYGRGTGNLRPAGRPTHGPHLTPAAPDVSSGISPDVIRRVVLRNIGQVNRCYEQGLAVNPALTGRVAVRFVIAGGGAVLASSVAQDNLGAPAVGACIAEAVRRWNFPVPEASGPITVTYPFNLMPAE